MTKYQKVESLKSGQFFKTSQYSKFEEVGSVHEFESGVMVYLKGEESNPFASSSFASYPVGTLVEVL
jgi:hypothetical protein